MSQVALTIPFQYVHVSFRVRPQVILIVYQFASFLSKYLHTITYFSPILPSVMIPDFFSETRPLSMKDISPLHFLKQLWKSDWSEGRDAIPWDCTFEASEERDEEWERSIALQGSRSRTWFRSYVSNFVSILFNYRKIRSSHTLMMDLRLVVSTHHSHSICQTCVASHLLSFSG